MEIEILNYIQNFRNEYLDIFFKYITKLGDVGIIWILLTLVFLIYKPYRKYAIVLALALVIDFIFCNLILKNLIARTRPFDINTSIQLLINKPRDYSFPSGHTGVSFASAFTLLFLKVRYWYIALILSILIAISRMYLYVHFPTDIIGGILVGLFSAVLAVYIVNFINRRNNELRR